MRKASSIIAVLVLLVVAWVFLFTGPPLFGRKLALKSAHVRSIELSMSTRREITASNLCAEVMLTLGKARHGGPVHTCPCLGTLTIHYVDGTTNRFDLMFGHRFNRLDLVDFSGSGMYSVATGKMFGTLESVGLMTKQ